LGTRRADAVSGVGSTDRVRNVWAGNRGVSVRTAIDCTVRFLGVEGVEGGKREDKG